MKKVLYMLTLAAFLLSAPLAMALEKASPPQMATSVNCCVKGKCQQVKGEADCAKAGGKIVKDCKDCK
jgi:hypothetical protein